MFKAIAVTALLATTAGFAAPTAQADIITFEFGQQGTGSFVFGNGDNRAYRATVNGLQLTARGFELDTPSVLNNNTPGSDFSGETLDREQVTRDTSGTNQGLGINSDGDQSSSQIDGNDGGNDDIEILGFTFRDAMDDLIQVTLREIVFNNADSDDDFGLTNATTVLLNDQSIAPASGSSFAFDASPFGFASSIFGIFADSGNAGNGENFKIRSITVERAMAVSEPATLALLGLGALGLAGMRRRKA